MGGEREIKIEGGRKGESGEEGAKMTQADEDKEGEGVTGRRKSEEGASKILRGR